MPSKSTDFSSAYKLTRQKENSSTRVKRRSIDWKNNRYEEVGKRRNLNKMSPLQEFGQNLSSSKNTETHNYDGKTPSKKGCSTKQTSRKEMLLKWREERKLKQQQESKKDKPSFKVHHVKHTDSNLYNINAASAKTTTSSKVKAPIAQFVAATKTARTTRGTKSVTSTISKGFSNSSSNSKQVSSRNVNKTVHQTRKLPSPPVTRRVTRQMTSIKAAEKKNPFQLKLEKAEKVKKSSTATKVAKKASPDRDLRRVATQRGAGHDREKSFAPNDYTFAAPSNLTSFTFKPLSPASAADFLCVNNEAASTSFFSTDPDVGRCSTPWSKKTKTPKQTADNVNDGQTVNSGTSMIVEPSVENRKSDEKVFKCTPVKRSRRKSSSSIETFREPEEPRSVRRSTRKRRKTTACDIPPELRSPEEWVQVLASSPMVEMSRRTPKTKTPPGRPQPIPIEPLNFDDLDDDIPYILNQISQTVTSTEEAVSMDANSNGASMTEPTTVVDGERDVKYFRNLLATETAHLQNFCIKWNSLDTTNSGITEESEGQIRTVVGQAQLIVDQRFKQFRGLVDDCEFKRGEKETTCSDLQGFWDMIFFQVQDVDKKFEELEKLKDKNWMVEKMAEKKKTVKRKPITTKTSKTAVVSKFARFRAEMKKNKQEVKEDTAESFKVFDAGFFKVRSPVKSPAVSVNGSDLAKQLTKSDIEKSEDCLASTSNDDMEEKHSEPPVMSKVLQVVKTPTRRSYAPCVPSPLLTDITPKRFGRRSLSGGQDIVQRKLIEEVEGKENCPEVESVEKHITSPTTVVPDTSSPARKTFNTPRRRSLRLRSISVNENGDTFNAPETCGLDLKYFEPSTVESPVHSRRKRRSTLKMPPSSAKRRSRPHSVRFSNASPLQDKQDSHTSLPCTPYNRDSLVARSRVTKKDVLIDLPDFSDDSDSRGVNSCVSATNSRPSLLFTPETQDKISTCSSEDNLINFSPL